MAMIYGDDLANDLSGTAGADSIYGLGGDDTITANAGDSVLGEVVDKCYGGLGDDVYNLYRTSAAGTYILNRASSVLEEIDQGYDVVNLHTQGAITMYYMDVNIEELNAYGEIANIWGGSGDDVVTVSNRATGVAIMGRNGDDVLYGSDYSDRLDGGSGVDGMVGGKGDDFYVVDKVNDIVIEYANQGWDEVQSLAGIYKIGNNVEGLYLDAQTVQKGTGNSLDNYIEASNDYTKFVNGGAGNDTIRLVGAADDLVIGGVGDDTLQAGLGGDVYRTSGAFGRDEITDTGGGDAVEFDVNESTLWFSKNGNDLNVSVIGTQNGVTIKNWYSDSSAKIEEFYAGTGKLLTAAKVDSLVSAMSGFAQPSSTTLPTNIQTALAPTLAAAWQ